MKKFLMIFLTVCMVVSCMIVSAFAAEETYAPIPASWSNYIIAKDSTYYNAYCFTCDDSLMSKVYNPSTSSVEVTMKDSSPLRFKAYYCRPGSASWGEGNSGDTVSTSSLSLPLTGYVVVASDYDIYSTDGSLFFPVEPTLGETVQALTEEQSTMVQNQTVGVMKILVPCGVGCLALLMALPVLKKGFLRFLH